ncbi:MAG: response regulator [Deltaproteobacteria bacterium]|nr:response regulator [Deltaproteobacteria bacterium]
MKWNIGQCMKALIVQEDTEHSHELTKILLHAGLSVERVGTYRESLDKATWGDFDLVFLDMSTPDMPAEEAEKIIPKLKEALPFARFIVMTADNTRDLEKRVRKQGILYYMTKPFDFNALSQLIRHQIQRARHLT